MAVSLRKHQSNPLMIYIVVNALIAMGHIGCTSFFPSKNLGCFGDGGAIFTNDDQLAAELRSVANHGILQQCRSCGIGSGVGA